MFWVPLTHVLALCVNVTLPSLSLLYLQVFMGQPITVTLSLVSRFEDVNPYSITTMNESKALFDCSVI